MLKNDISKLHYIIKWCVFVEITKGRQTSWFVCWASTCFQYLKIQDVVCVQVASWVIIVVIFWTGTSQSTLYTSHHFIEPVHLLIPDGHMQRGTCSSCCQQCSFSFVCDSGKLHLWGFFFFFFSCHLHDESLKLTLWHFESVSWCWIWLAKQAMLCTNNF